MSQPPFKAKYWRAVKRRDFLKWTGVAMGAAALEPTRTFARGAAPQMNAAGLREMLLQRFRTILEGFLRNAKATSATYTVCDFPRGTKVAGCLTPSKKSYVGVARMLPAISDYLAMPGAQANVAVDGQQVDLHQVVLSIYRTAFNPKHLDYWGEPPTDKATQRTVESSLVALSLARLGPEFVGKLSSEERAHINQWLASCTVVPERTNNHAWFTAVNQAARLKLAKSFPEFKGDEAWMVDDLKAMDGLAANAADGWYSDDPKLTVYDYYNFWTFGNFPLFWSRIAGEMYPEWHAKLRARGKEFLQWTPYFFAEDGAIALFGRSLFYRIAVLSPLVMGYEQGIWPHSAGLLKRIVGRHFEWWWRMGAYDEKLGKLRETLSPAGTKDVTENYIDNGHPYWAMQAFTFFSIPASDPLWSGSEEALPVEKGDYLVKIPGPRMLLAGSKDSGQVKWLQATNTPRRDYYRDKYNKLCWSSAFPFNVIQVQGKKELPPPTWDQALVFQDEQGGYAWRAAPQKGELLEDGVRTTWVTKLGGQDATVVTSVRLAGDFEWRKHEVTFAMPVSATAMEGSYALGLAEGEETEKQVGEGWLALRSKEGKLVVSWRVAGHEKAEVVRAFGPAKQESVNIVYPRMAMVSLSKKIGKDEKQVTLVSLHYASPRPMGMEKIQEKAGELLKKWQ